MIAVGIIIVIIGLAFLEGLRLGLMPLGETLGSTLQEKDSRHPMFAHKFGLWFRAGSLAIFAEPAIGVLRPQVQVLIPLAPLLWTILNTVPPTWLIPLG